MPNWVIGNVEIKSKIENLKEFCLKGLEPVKWLGDNAGVLAIDENGILKIPTKETYDCWIIDTHRHFIDSLYIDFNDLDSRDNDICVINLNIRAAWIIEAVQLQNVCKRYDVDMEVEAVEEGDAFKQKITIKNGEIVEDETIELFREEDE